jgi:hypothetical protein
MTVLTETLLLSAQNATWQVQPFATPAAFIINQIISPLHHFAVNLLQAVFDFDRACKDFQALIDSDSDDKQWVRRLVEARSMRDMSHYGILGVKRDADAAILKKAYRSLCLRWHPDKHSKTPEDMERAHTAFRVCIS